MVDVSRVFAVLQICVLAIIISSTLVYSIPFILLRRFRHRIHVFTINICMAILCCSIYWLVFFMMKETNVRQFYNAKTCSLVFYAQTMCTLQVPLALMVVSIHRLCRIVYYNKMFFKSKRWISMCVGCQWIVGIVISLPVFLRNQTACIMLPWMRYYTLTIIIVVPVSVCVVINIIIFTYVQSSSRRIQPISQARIANHNNDQQPKLSRRDIHLLRHMIIMFFVFIVGWGPIYITSVILNQASVNPFILRILSLLAEISLLCDIIDLFLYSHELRQYLQRTLLPCYYN